MHFRRWLLFLLLLHPLTYAQEQADIFDLGDRYFETIGDEESIPAGIIQTIIQDKQGFLWFGTQQGLVRYDGYRFRLFQYHKDDPDSLSGNFVNTLWAAPDGRVWVGTRSNGISVFNPSTEKFTRYPAEKKSTTGIADNYVAAILGDDQQGVWVGTREGLDKIHLASNTIEHYNLNLHKNSLKNNDNRVGALVYDQNHSLLVGTSRGICRLDPVSKSCATLIYKNDTPNNELNEAINRLFLGKDGKIWIATENNGIAWLSQDNSLQRLKSDPTRADKLSHSFIMAMAQPTDDEIWLASYGGGIDVLNAKTGAVIDKVKHDDSVASSINLNSLGSLFVDDSGLLWIGTWGGGLNLYNPKNKAFRTLHHSSNRKNSLSYSDILSVMEANNGDIWIGTRGNGIDIFDSAKGLVKQINADHKKQNGLTDNSISVLFQSKNGTIWVGTRQTGLFRYRPQTDDFMHYTTSNGLTNDVVKCLLEDAEGNLWIGTSLGVYRLNMTSQQITPVKTKDGNSIQGNITSLAKFKDGTVFVGSDVGLFRLKSNETSLSRLEINPDNEFALSHNTVFGLYVDENDELWVSTQQGLDKLKEWKGKHAEFESINKMVGYPNQPLWANLMRDSFGRIWDGTSIINLQTKTRRELTKADAVDNGVNWYAGYAKTKNGTLLYVGSKGLLMVKPELFTEWNYQPPLAITQLTINGKAQPIEKNQSLTLNSDLKGFSVEFSALDFSDPNKNRYAYQLQGYDHDWNEISSDNRTASYTNLPPGQYQLQIKGSNRLGVFSQKKINLDIIILPKWYQTNWFKMIVFLLASGILYLIYFVRVGQLNRHKEKLHLLVEQRTDELKQSNKTVNTLSDIGVEISSTLELGKILNTVYFYINKMMDANVFCIGFFNEEAQEIDFRFVIERGEKLPAFTLSMNQKERLAVWCVENKKPIVINDFAIDKPKYFEKTDYIPPQSGDDTESVIYWPLIVRDKIIGTLTVQSFTKNAYTETHQKIISALASTASIAIDNATAYRKAKKAAEIKSTFLANMSHEIRTPMHGILGLTKLIEKTPLNLEQKEYVKNIGISADTLLSVINDILDFSKIEAGKMLLEHKPFSLTQLFNNMHVVMQTISKQKKIDFNYVINKDVPPDLIGDPQKINQILLNLCSNAIKFTEQGHVLVEVSIEEKTKDSCLLRVDVTDQGIGISADIIPTLFNSFSQADVSTTRKYGGTGLGLAISRLLARKMDGDISLESKEGIGSCFTLKINLPIFELSKPENIKRLKFDAACIILILDAEKNFNLIEQKLTQLDAKVYRAECHQGKIDKQPISHLNFDIALLHWEDIKKYREDILFQLKHDFKLLPEQIIVYSEKAIHAIIKKVSLLGIENILQKPLSILQTQSLIYEHAKCFTNAAQKLKFPLQAIRILVVEDNKVNQLIATKLLNSRGASVDIANNGVEALQKVSMNPYDVILMDIQMPEMDGTEATVKIRENPDFKELPIIAMTANVLEDDVKNYKRYGMNDHVSKPINTEDLINKIKKYTQKSSKQSG